MFKPYLLIFILLFSSALIRCSSSDKIDTNSAEGAFKLAQKYEKDERFEEAITYYSEVKNKYPYSQLAIEAELKIGDVEYTRENFAEAESAYKLFKEYHPDHARSDYVTYRLGLSVFNQLPSTIDRDLKLAATAIEHFSQVLSNYPKSEFTKLSQENKKKAEQMLADKIYYIANYYYIRNKWQSALGRFEDLVHNHTNLGYDIKALYGATLSAYKMKDVEKAKSYFKKLLAGYPNSTELAQARKELSNGF